MFASKVSGAGCGCTDFRTDRFSGLLPVLAFLTAGLIFLAQPPTAAAFHNDPQPSGAGDVCDDCHTLDGQQADFDTSAISFSARTLPQMRVQFGGTLTAPPQFGCTFCHDGSSAGLVNMGDALTDYGAPSGSSHYVGRNINTGLQTDRELQSGWTGLVFNGTGGYTTDPNEVACTDCHLISGTYPNHASAPAGNPDRLRGTVTNPADLNAFCTGVCHGSGVDTLISNSRVVPDMGHIGWGAFSDNGTASGADDTMRTGRGSAIATADCGVCHNRHASLNDNLLGDGYDNVRVGQGGITRAVAVDEATCVGTCHVAPANYETEGHGQFAIFQGMNLTRCGPCHSSADPHRGTNPKRLSSPETGGLAGIEYNGAGDSLDNDFDGVLDDTGGPNGIDEANWAYERNSMCNQCHFSYFAHGGTIGTGQGIGFASCLDCHDPHGITVPGANTNMIRGIIGGTAAGFPAPETATYAGTADFYRADGNGLCDNANCHGSTLAAIMADTASPGYIEHSSYQGTGVVYGTNCFQCHSHEGTASFKAECNNCHGYPPATGAHDLHNLQLGYSCYDCHFGNIHNQGSFVTGDFTIIPDVDYTDFYDAAGNQYDRSMVNVDFDSAGPIANNGSLPDPTGTKHATNPDLTTCNDLACHNPDMAVTNKINPAGDPGSATDNTPAWGGAITTCLHCHGRSTSAALDPASHYLHDTTKGYVCESCHNDVDIGQGFPPPTARSNHGDLTMDAGQVTFGDPDGPGPIALTGSENYAAGSCSNVYCHGEFNGGDTANNPSWGGTAACGSCHGAAAASPPQGYAGSVSHTRHAGNGAGQYSMPCNLCHVTTTTTGNTITNQALHVNGRSEVDLDNSDPRIGAASYGGSTAVGDSVTEVGTDVCSNLYCHGGIAPFPLEMQGTNQTPEWDQQATGACGSCHVDEPSDFTASPPPAVGSGAHMKHAGDVFVSNYAMPCSTCHVSVTTTGNTITGPALHVNLQANVLFDTADPRLAGTVAGDYGGTNTVGDLAADTGDLCTNIYCHSQGTSFTPPFPEPNNTTVQWDTGSLPCGACHGFPPLYADGTPKSNKHENHLVNILGFNMQCNTCHGWWASVVPGEHRANHVNRVYNPESSSINAMDDFTFTPGAGGQNGTCSATVCHGGNTVAWNIDMTQPPWNANDNHFTCDVCHSELLGVPTNVDVNDFFVEVTSPTAVMSKVSASEYNSVGHGSGAYHPPDNVNIGKACSDCHDSTVMHERTASDMSSPNPFRLRDQDGATAGIQTCLNVAGCHVSTIGPATGVDISTFISHSDEGMGADSQRTWPAWNPICTDCHDPHGDGTNLSMIQREIYDKGSLIGGAFSNTASDPQWAVPDETANDNDALVFTNESVGADAAGTTYANTISPFSSLCQECHERATVSNGVQSFHDGPAGGTASASNHPSSGGNPGDCSDCHTHDTAFKPSGCNACHGDTVTGQFWPSGSGGTPAYVDDSAGGAEAHDKHIEVISQYLGTGTIAALLASPTTDVDQVVICAACHPGPGGSGHTANSGDSRVDLYGGTGPGDRYQVFLDGAGTMGDDINGAATYGLASGTCSNLDCHYETTTPLYGGTGWNNATAGGDPDCETCHFYRDGVTYPTAENWNPATPQLPDAHQAHTGGVAPPNDNQGKRYPCSYCHNVTGYTARHSQGSIDLDVSATPNFSGDEGTIGGTAVVKYGAGAANTTCSGIYCHGADFSIGTQGANITPVWNNHTTGTCGDCHDINTESVAFKQELTQGAHGTHMAQASGTAWGPGLGSHARNCSDCHGSKPSQGCNNYCHTTSGGLMPGGGADNGYVWEPSLSHVEGNFEIDFANRDRGWNTALGNAATGTLANLAATDICDRCHSTATVNGTVGATQAKANWATATRLACENCHHALPSLTPAPAMSLPVTSGIAAPDVMGDDISFGAEINGHGKSAGSHDNGRPAASEACGNCHDNTVSHVDGADGSAIGDYRFVGTINGVNVSAATAVEQVCNACHQNAGSGIDVSSHGNTDADFQASSTHDDAAGSGEAEDFVYRCDACHEPHGMSLNANSNPNLYMVKANIEVRNTSTPAWNDELTVLPIVFESKTGADSYDDGAGANRLCVACHTNGARPGFTTNLDNPAGDATHAGLGDYSDSEVNSDCTGCHTHDYDGTPVDVDGFMPQCNRCHDYPGLPAIGGHALSATHDIHAGTPGAGPANYGFPCSRCHNGSDHNTAAVMFIADEADWTAKVNVDADVQVNFDTFNAVAQATNNAPLGDATSFNDTSNECSNLYCHGVNNTAPVLPDWDTGTTVVCGSCHGDPADNGRPDGNEPPASGIGGNHTTASHQVACTVCHTHMGADFAEHVNGDGGHTVGDALVSSGGTGVTTYVYGGASHVASPDPDGFKYSGGTCTPSDAVACHSPAAWGDTGGCNFCHGYPPLADGGPNDKHASGTEAVDHERGTDNGALLMANHNDCGYCHGVRDSGSGTLQAQDTATLLGNAATGTYDVTAGTGDHRDGSVTMNDDNNATATDDADYNPATGGCANAACHGDNPAHRLVQADAGAWPSTSTISPLDIGPGSCASCHGDGAAEAWPQSVGTNDRTHTTYASFNDDGRHTIHMTRIAARLGITPPGTIPQQTTMCVYCHVLSDGDHATLGAAETAEVFPVGGRLMLDGTADAGTAASFNGTTYGCASVDCHDSKDTTATYNWYTGAASTCTMCHTAGGGVAGEDINPTSGLHANAAAVVRDHDETLGSGCAQCHAPPAITTSLDHIGGTAAANDTSDATNEFYLNATMDTAYVDGALDSGTCSGTGVNIAAGCHSDNGGWSRRWSTAADSISEVIGDARCDVCHGDGQGTDTTWNTGVVDHNIDQNDPDAIGGEILGNHSDGSVCGKCHGIGTSGYPSTYTWSTNHESGAIMMNGPDVTPGPIAGTEYDDAAGGCNNACHLPSFTFVATSDDFDVEYGDFGGPTCYGCHGGATTGVTEKNFWPDSGTKTADDTASEDDEGAHVKHVEALATAIWGETITGAADNDVLRDNTTANSGISSYQKQVTICIYCHPNRSGDAYLSVAADTDHYTKPEQAELPLGKGDNAVAALRFRFLDGTVDTDGDFGTYTVPGSTCATIDCHNNTLTPAWYSGATLNCSDCHSGITTHLKLTPAGADQACEACHPGGSTNPNKHTAAGNGNTIEIPLPPANWTDPSGRLTSPNNNMQERLGISYAFGGIHLGGENTLASPGSEAEICWDCHGTNDAVNEWGYNTDTNGAGYPVTELADVNSATSGSYNYGYLYSDASWTTPTPAWIDTGGNGMYRKDGYQHDTDNTFALSRRISSLHSVNFSVGSTPASSVARNVDVSGNVIRGTSTQSFETRAQIRCSYCHDVHNLNLANGGAGYTDGQTGPPYLRGSWMGNPYPPDMPPLNAYSYELTGTVGPPNKDNGNRYTVASTATSGFAVGVPRLFSHTTGAGTVSRMRGGYFIDQNSNWPTGASNPSYDTIQETAGLCVLCHDDAVDTMDYWTGSTLWRGANGTKNGHANSTLGGTGSASTYASEIFDGTRGNGGTRNVWMGQQRSVPERANGGNVNYGVNATYGEPKDFGPFAVFTPSEPANSGDNEIPASNSGWYGGNPGTTAVGSQYGSWYSTAGAIGTNADPGGRAHDFTCSKCHSPHATGLPALLITNCLDRTVGTWDGDTGAGSRGLGPGGATSGSGSWEDKVQVNCHRKDGTTSGWNRLNAGQ